MTHTTVLVPNGHTVIVHHPGAEIGVPHATGMIPNAATEGAKAAMDAAIPAAQGPGSPAEVQKHLKRGAGGKKDSAAEGAQSKTVAKAPR